MCATFFDHLSIEVFSVINFSIRLQTTSTTQDPLQMPRMTNCRELLTDRLQVQWDINANEVQIQLTGRITQDQYMAFGISGETGRCETSKNTIFT